MTLCSDCTATRLKNMCLELIITIDHGNISQITEEWEDTASRDVEKFKMDVTTHVSIHTLHLDGLRELFRHFLRLSDGAILEVCILSCPFGLFDFILNI